MHTYIISKVKLSPFCRGGQKASFSISIRSVGEGVTPFPGLLHFTPNTYLILLSVKLGGIRYHFKNLWYEETIGGPLANTLVQ